MLQLPNNDFSPFTKAHLADIARGGKVVVRDIRDKPDPVIRRIEAFKKAVRASEKSGVAFKRAKERLEKMHALDASLFVYCADHRALLDINTTFYSLEHIEKTAKGRRARLRWTIANERKLLKERDEDSFLKAERKAFIAKDCQHLRDLPAVVAKVRRDFIRNQSRVRGCQRRVKYLTFARIDGLGHRRVQNTFDAVLKSEIRTKAGAAALIEFAGFVLNSRAFWYGDISELLRRVSKFVKAKS